MFKARPVANPRKFTAKYAIKVKQVVSMRRKYISTMQEMFWYTDMQISRFTSSIIHLKRIQLTTPYEQAGILKTDMLGNAKIEFLSQETHNRPMSKNKCTDLINVFITIFF